MHAPPYLLCNLTQLMLFVLFNRQIFTIILLAEARNLAQDARNLLQDSCNLSQDAHNLAQDARTTVSVA